MADLRAFAAFNMNMFQLVSGFSTEASRSTIVFTDGHLTDRYTGSFTYSSSMLSGGTITEFERFGGSQLRLQVTELDLDARTLAQNLTTTQIYGLIFGRSDSFTGSGQADVLLGYGGDDVIRGQEGNDRLLGGLGADRIEAGTGSDRLTGGAGRDTLVGGTDALADGFIYLAVSDSRAGAADVIRNFTRGADRINLDAIDVRPGTPLDQDFLWGGQTAAARSVWWSKSGSDVILHADVTGDTTADLAIVLKGLAGFGQADVIL